MTEDEAFGYVVMWLLFVVLFFAGIGIPLQCKPRYLSIPTGVLCMALAFGYGWIADRIADTGNARIEKANSAMGPHIDAH